MGARIATHFSTSVRDIFEENVGGRDTILEDGHTDVSYDLHSVGHAIFCYRDVGD